MAPNEKVGTGHLHPTCNLHVSFSTILFFIITVASLIQDVSALSNSSGITRMKMCDYVLQVTVNADDMEIQVSTDGSGKQQQVIFYKNGEAHLLPSILLGGGGKNLGSQIVVQEISLPEARNLESLVIGNTNQLPRKVTPRGTSELYHNFPEFFEHPKHNR